MDRGSSDKTGISFQFPKIDEGEMNQNAIFDRMLSVLPQEHRQRLIQQATSITMDHFRTLSGLPIKVLAREMSATGAGLSIGETPLTKKDRFVIDTWVKVLEKVGTTMDEVDEIIRQAAIQIQEEEKDNG
jgi:hypothetical protein